MEMAGVKVHGKNTKQETPDFQRSKPGMLEFHS